VQDFNQRPSVYDPGLRQFALYSKLFWERTLFPAKRLYSAGNDFISDAQRYGLMPDRSFHRQALRQISRLIDIRAFEHCDVISQQLHGNGEHNGGLKIG
jgi:hypothetical protein